jgi:hypothetical protein
MRVNGQQHKSDRFVQQIAQTIDGELPAGVFNQRRF